MLWMIKYARNTYLLVITCASEGQTVEFNLKNTSLLCSCDDGGNVVYCRSNVFPGCVQWGTYPVQSSLWCNHRAIQLKKVSKNSEKNLECASQPTSSIYKISGSNSSSSRSYKKDKFRLHLNYYFCQKICLFCNF